MESFYSLCQTAAKVDHTAFFDTRSCVLAGCHQVQTHPCKCLHTCTHRLAVHMARLLLLRQETVVTEEEPLPHQLPKTTTSGSNYRHKNCTRKKKVTTTIIIIIWLGIIMYYSITFTLMEEWGSAVNDALDLWCVVVMSLSPINLLRKSSSIIPMYSEWSGQIWCQAAPYADDSFVYICWLYAIHSGSVLPFTAATRCKSDSSDVFTS